MTTWHRHNLAPIRTVAPVAGPYLTPDRLRFLEVARAFAMDEVLQVANELDPRHADIPEPQLVRMGELGYSGS